MMKTAKELKILHDEVIRCHLCPRLVEYREHVAPRRAHLDEIYWRRPVPGFGDPKAWLMITGLAPAAEGGNRTGRIFTGDATSRFLFKALYHFGFANQPNSESVNDDLILNGCYLTAAVKCVPPQNKPTRHEFRNCSRYYQRELELLKELKCVLALGKLAFDAYLYFAKSIGIGISKLKFAHGAYYELSGVPDICCSYHPTPRNTQTGTLTEEMFFNLFKIIKEKHHDQHS
jgi:uracil-DNA glycosylase family 4